MPYYSGVKQVRWLASRYRAVTAVEDHLRVTVEHLENVAASHDPGAATATGLLNKLKDVKMIHFMYFIMDFMALMLWLSKQLQGKSILVTDVSHYISEVTMKMVALKSSPGENESKFTDNFDTEQMLLNHGKGIIKLTSSSRAAPIMMMRMTLNPGLKTSQG